jgi:hypothetical protein
VNEEVVLEQERARVSDVNGEERGRESQGTFTGDEEPARPANGPAARDFTAVACAREERMQGVHERRKGVREGSSTTLIAQGRERER